MSSIDTNGLLRLLLDDVPGAAAAVEQRLDSDGPLVVADVALVELVSVLDKVLGISRKTVADSVGAIFADARLTCGRDVWRDVLSVWTAHPKLSVVDVYLAETARRSDEAPLFTFDRKLAGQIDAAELM